MRVGHEEREQVVLVLTQQCAEGRLTADELDRLSAEARSARTFADLDRLVADLPVIPPSTELRRGAANRDLALLGTHPDHRLTLSAGMSSHVRRGVWTVPAYLRVNAGMATVKLDFQQALCPHAVVDLAISGGLGSVVLVVPEGWAANTDQVSRGIGSVSNKLDAVPQPGKPLLVLHGSAMMGSVKVRYAGWRDRRLMRKALQQTGSDAVDAASAGGGGTRGGPGQDPGASGPQDAPLAPQGRTDPLR